MDRCMCLCDGQQQQQQHDIQCMHVCLGAKIDDACLLKRSNGGNQPEECIPGRLFIFHTRPNFSHDRDPEVVRGDAISSPFPYLG